jgi:hypothetical protein
MGPITAQNNAKNSAEKMLTADRIFDSNQARMIVEKIRVVARLTAIFGANTKNNF